MRRSRAVNAFAVFKTALLAVGSSTTLACAGGTVPPSGSLVANPASLTFANPQSAAQQLVITGGTPPVETSAGNLGSGCFGINSSTANGDSTTLSVVPQGGALGACIIQVYAAGANATYVPVNVGVQMQPNSTVTYSAAYLESSPSTVAIVSSSPQVAAVPASVSSTYSNSIGVPVVTFTITSSAVVGSTVIHVFENGTSQPATFSIPVLVSSGPAPTPTPSAAPTGAPTAAPSSAPTASPTAPPSGNSFTLASSPSFQSFALVGSPVAAQLFFYGAVTISGASSENVTYSETSGVPANGCAVSGTLADAITLTFPTAFQFAPNGSFGPNTGLLDTVFAPASPTGTYYGAIYQAGSCATPFDAAAQTVPASTTTYEYPGGGNTSVPAGTYVLELWQ